MICFAVIAIHIAGVGRSLSFFYLNCRMQKRSSLMYGREDYRLKGKMVWIKEIM